MPRLQDIQCLSLTVKAGKIYTYYGDVNNSVRFCCSWSPGYQELGVYTEYKRFVKVKNLTCNSRPTKSLDQNPILRPRLSFKRINMKITIIGW